MSLLGVELAVRERLGIDPGSLGAAVLPQAVGLRLKAREVATTEAYLGILASDPAEVEALVAELVVGETWFFRGGRTLFNRLAELIASRAGDEPMGRPVRILSAPCSTGEEPYSLAIAFHEQMIPPERYHIDAVDVSARHLERAAVGQFAAFAFREAGTDIRPPCFRPQGDRWEILPHLRQLVQFRTGNITAPAFLAGESPYDLILCRNLFIYLTPEARQNAMATLDRLLSIDGRLCLTPGEADRLPPARFVVEGPSEFGIYRRVGVGSGVQSAALLRQARPVPKPQPREMPPPIPLPPAEPLPPAPANATPADTLETAHNLANGGRLAEALAMCDRIVGAGAASAEAYTLLGAIHQAQGNTADAAEAFRRALYLDPDQAEALSHMIVISDRRGDATQAAALRRRLARLTPEDTP